MPPRLADRLRECLEVFHAGVTVPKALIEETAAELDRREALVTAAEAWAKAQRAREGLDPNDHWHAQVFIASVKARDALLALLPEEPHD
jgi:hypothetical protein